MSRNFSTTQTIRKTVTPTAGGLVAAQHRRAAQTGAEILAAGGNAVDAAIAVSFALGVVEPWMSGPAGGGAMVIWRAQAECAVAFDFGMRAPAGLDPADYPLAGTGKAGDLFPWDAVTGDRNIQGAGAIAVPGLIDGVGAAHARFGTMPWRELVAPAIALARDGIELDWYTALVIASATRALAQDPDAAALFLDDGQWPPVTSWTSTEDKRIHPEGMADTLETLAADGARAFYEGDVAAAMVADVRAKGGALSMDDLRDYRAQEVAPLSFRYRDAMLHTAPGLTAGPTLRDALAAFERTVTPAGAPDADSFAGLAAALKAAYAQRLATMGDTGETPGAPGCTTHFCVVDRHGNMVSMTQTLLSLFGARVVSPGTGLLMNNGIMWFDPVPGKPNSLGPGKRCLMNICPVIGTQGPARFALGAAGGRKIVSTVTQLASLLVDHGMSLEAAFHHPRIDVSGGATVTADRTLAPQILERLRRDHALVTAPRAPFPYAFGCPAGVLRADGRNYGCTEVMSATGDTVAEDTI